MSLAAIDADLAEGSAVRPAAMALSRGTWLAIGLMFALGIAYQLLHPDVADVSWMLDVNARMLRGQRLYVDVIETNPPMAVFLYSPAVLLADATGVSAGICQLIVTLGAIMASTALTSSILAESGEARVLGRYGVAAALMLVAAPAYAFSEREHIALVLMLPMLAVMIARADAVSIGLTLRVIVGLGAGIAVSVKPHFALGLVAPAIYLAIRQRSFRPMFALENWLAATVVFAHLAFTLAVFPVYLSHIVPMLLQTYRQLKHAPLDLIVDPETMTTLCAALVTVLVLGRDALRPRVLVPLMAAGGLFAGFLEQGKGWIYQLYPALTLVFILFFAEALPRLVLLARAADRTPLDRLRFVASAVLGIGVLLGSVRMAVVLDNRNWAGVELAARIRRDFDHPRIIALSTDLSIGHPLTEMVGGTWVGTFGQDILTHAATVLMPLPTTADAEKAELSHWLGRDRALLARDLTLGRPDLVIVDRAHYPWDGLMASGSEAAILLAHYRRIDRIGDLDLLVPDANRAQTVANGARPD